MRNPVYLRGGVYWCYARNPNGGRGTRISTKCRDKAAAVAFWRELERQSVTPAHQAAAETSLADALDRRIAERTNAGRAAGTISMLTQKARHLNRLLGADTRLSRIGAAEIDGYVQDRLKEGASRSTVHKELVTLRGALRLAKRRGEYARDLGEVMPLDFSVKYKPKTRALSFTEIRSLLAKLPAPRRALVGFLIATGATYPSELARLRPSDVDVTRWRVRLRGTKRDSRDRVVPIVAFARPWVEAALPYLPFARWSNIRRDLHQACDAAKIARCSPNDLRRTLATLLRAHGVEPQLLAPMLGHADSRMVERVYGRLAPDQLQHLIDDRVASAGVQFRHGVGVKPQKRRKNAG